MNASLKPHQTLPKTVIDREPDPRPRGNDVATTGGPPVTRAPDEVQAAPPSVIEPEAGQTVGMAAVSRPADAVQSSPPSVIERNRAPIARSLDALSVVMMMVVAVFGFVKFLARPTYAKRVLAFGAMRRSQEQRVGVRPVDLSWRSRKPIEADLGAASGLDSVKRALDAIQKAEAEMAASRQLRKSM